MLILIVTDDIGLTEQLVRVFKEAAIKSHITQATSAKARLRTLESIDQFDYAVIDLDVVDLNRDALLKLSITHAKRLSVALVSDDAPFDLINQFLAAGALGFIYRQTQPELLAQAIEQHLLRVSARMQSMPRAGR